jgi:hypothetical protein
LTLIDCGYQGKRQGGAAKNQSQDVYDPEDVAQVTILDVVRQKTYAAYWQR